MYIMILIAGYVTTLMSFAKKNDKNNSLTFLPNDLLKDKDLDIKNTVIVKDGNRDLKKSEAVILMLDKINFKKTSFFRSKSFQFLLEI